MSKEQLKKYVTWQTLVFIVAVQLVGYLLFTYYHVQLKEQGKSASSSIVVHELLLEEYGESPTREDWETFFKKGDRWEASLDEWVRQEPRLKQQQITTTDELVAWSNVFDEDIVHTEKHKVARAVLEEVMFDGKPEDVSQQFWMMEELKRLHDFYEWNDRTLAEAAEGRGEGHQLQTAFAQSLLDRGTIRAQPELMLEHLKKLNFESSLFLVYTVLLVITPVIGRDSIRRIVPLEYTTWKGRTVIRTKRHVAHFVSIVIALIVVGMYSYLLWKGGYATFCNVPVQQLITGDIWLDVTLGELWLIFYVHHVVLAILAADIAWQLNTYFETVLTRLGMLLFVITCYTLFIHRFVASDVWSAWQPMFYTPLYFLLLFLLICCTGIFVVRHEKKKDVV